MHSTESTLPDAVILLGRGGTGAAARETLHGLAQALQMRMAESRVLVGFIDKAAPSLPQALDLCVGARTVVVLPLLSPDEPALTRWLHKVAMRWRERQQAGGPSIRFAPALMAAELLPELAREQAMKALQQADVAETAGPQWRDDPVGWSNVPAHTHHALVCLGPRCTALGAVAVWDAVGDALKATPALQRRLRPLQTSCQYPCNHGPLAIVYPEGVWYGRLEVENVGEVLRAHVLEGRADPGHLVHRLQSE
nr:(2Fe-2S) ferredoxin domain-containing protein [Variovorax boronicumulans]